MREATHEELAGVHSEDYLREVNSELEAAGDRPLRGERFGGVVDAVGGKSSGPLRPQPVSASAETASSTTAHLDERLE